MNIGLVGYSKQEFNQTLATQYIEEAFDVVEEISDSLSFSLVSDLTDIGVPLLGYREANKRGWNLVGVACTKAHNFPCYPVNERIIVGQNWGDESQIFLDMLDILIRVGGGEQSKQECAIAKLQGIMTIEYELEAINE